MKTFLVIEEEYPFPGLISLKVYHRESLKVLCREFLTKDWKSPPEETDDPADCEQRFSNLNGEGCPYRQIYESDVAITQAQIHPISWSL